MLWPKEFASKEMLCPQTFVPNKNFSSENIGQRKLRCQKVWSTKCWL